MYLIEVCLSNWSRGKQLILFLEILSGETKSTGFPRDVIKDTLIKPHSLTLYSLPRAVNIRVLPSDVIVLANHVPGRKREDPGKVVEVLQCYTLFSFWRQTVPLLDVM